MMHRRWAYLRVFLWAFWHGLHAGAVLELPWVLICPRCGSRFERSFL